MNKAAYRALLAPIVADYRRRPYEFWRTQIGGDPIHFEVKAEDGTECQVEINTLWDGKADGDIRVLFSIDDGGWRAWCPVTDDFVIAGDGKCVGEE